MLRLAKIMGLGFALAVTAPAYADFKAGMTAWEKGDYARAVKEWKVAAATGDADAQFNLGQAYRQGLGVSKDPAQAEALFQKAAAQNQPRAQLLMANILQEKGKPAEAVPWLEKSAMRGDKDAQYQLGFELYQGKNVARDLARAYAFMTIADKASQAKAKDALVVMERAIPADQKEKGKAMATQISAGIARTQQQMQQQAAARAQATAGAGASAGGGVAIAGGE